MATQALQLFGFKVLEAPSAAAALGMLERDNSVDLMLTDIIMPHMNGRELARQLATRRPELKIVFMSGYAEQAAVKQGLLDPDQVFISKPFTPESLVRKLRGVLDGTVDGAAPKDVPKDGSAAAKN
jgi:CheY-like chemotaxis protein